MYFFSLKKIERYHLEFLLRDVRGANNFKELKSFDGVIYEILIGTA